MKIKKLNAYEILDSRGNPTVKAEVELESGIKTSANVPSGASTGEHEALELRDEDEGRFHGKGVLKACENVNRIIAPDLVGMDVTQQFEIDEKMLDLDGTKNKSKLGANAILSVSLAVARAASLAKGVNLYEHILDLSEQKGIVTTKEPGALKLPTPTCNVINGGAHANWVLDFQEYMLVPSGIDGFMNQIRAVSEIYQVLKKKLKKDGMAVSVGDEGGFAPKLGGNEKALQYLVESISEAGFKPGEEISLAMDTAASEFYNKETDKYELKADGKSLDSSELIEFYGKLIDNYPIILIEDGMAEDDLAGWTNFKSSYGDKISIMGDDFTVTNKERLKMALDNNALNSILIKLNQIGSVTETLDCIKLAYDNQADASVSHRSGETADDFIADFAFGVQSKWIKSGSVARSERVAKYNRLIEIERQIKTV